MPERLCAPPLREEPDDVEDDDDDDDDDDAPLPPRRRTGKWSGAFRVLAGTGGSATKRRRVEEGATSKPILVQLGLEHPLFRALMALLRFQEHGTRYTLTNVSVFEVRNSVTFSTHATHFLNAITSVSPGDALGPFQLSTLHGTRLEAAIAIALDEHNRGFASSEFTSNSGLAAFGSGHYTTVSAPYAASAMFARPDNEGFRTMLLCRVLTIVPKPGKPGKATVTIDRPGAPTHVVAHHEDSLQPVCIIRFKNKFRG
jgi:hypothetical protein